MGVESLLFFSGITWDFILIFFLVFRERNFLFVDFKCSEKFKGVVNIVINFWDLEREVVLFYFLL